MKSLNNIEPVTFDSNRILNPIQSEEELRIHWDLFVESRRPFSDDELLSNRRTTNNDNH